VEDRDAIRCQDLGGAGRRYDERFGGGRADAAHAPNTGGAGRRSGERDSRRLREAGYHETAQVVDADGVIIATLRGDGVGAHSLDSALDKAYTAASFKSDTLALAERAKAKIRSGRSPSCRM
jgi:hypothetical protein